MPVIKSVNSPPRSASSIATSSIPHAAMHRVTSLSASTTSDEHVFSSKAHLPLKQQSQISKGNLQISGFNSSNSSLLKTPSLLVF